MSAGRFFTAATRHSIQLPVIVNNNKSLDPLRAKKTFIRKKLSQTVVSAIQASSPDFPHFLLHVRCKSGLTFVCKCFRDVVDQFVSDLVDDAKDVHVFS